MTGARGYAAMDASSRLAPHSFERREPRANDVAIRIQFCGICHSDLHQVRSEWPGTVYPCIPGHEIVGEVSAIGSAVTRFRVGDRVGVGCMVDSCRECSACVDGEEQYCSKGFVGTYNGTDRVTGENTLGGYSSSIVVREEFVLSISNGVDLAATAPLLCAGVTTYSPLRHWNIGPNKKVGVVGLGGLGHVAVRLAHAMGAEVVLFTTSEAKAEDAKRLGADEVAVSKSREQMKKQRNSCDLILDTVSAKHNLDDYLGMLKRDGTMVLLGVPSQPHPSPSISHLVFRRRSLAGSLIGGIRETQEMLDFCAQHGVVADIEKIAISEINEAYDRMLASEVKYRFVIDLATL